MSSNKRASIRDIFPSHHMMLSDDYGNSVGMVLVNGRGEPDIRGIRMVPYPRSTIQVGSGAGAWATRRPPFGQTVKSIFYGGMGMRDGDADATKYYYGTAWSVGQNGVMLPPHVAWCWSPWPYVIRNVPRLGNAVESLEMIGDHRYIAIKVQPSQNTSILGARFRIRFTDVPSQNVSVKIYSDSGDAPDTLLATSESVTYQDSEYPITSREVSYFLESALALTSGTYYWVVIEGPGYSSPGYAPEGMGIVETTAAVGNGAAMDVYGLKFSADGVTFAAGDPEMPVFELIPTLKIRDGKFFRYKWGMYCYMVEDNTARTVHLLLNGDRGVCDDNSGDLSYLQDATKNWIVDQFVGAYVRIYSGSGSGQWRKIIGNTATALEVERDWDQAHTTSNEYVILGSHTWQEISGHGLTATQDVAVTNRGVVYFCQNDATGLRRMREYNNSGVFTREFADDTTEGGNRLYASVDQSKGPVLWRARNGGFGDVAKAIATDWGTNLSFETAIKVGGLEQDINGLTEADQHIYVVKMDSVWAINPDGKPSKIIGWPMIWNRNSGRNPDTYSPYIVFPVRNGLVRLYNNLMEDFGPNKQDGLPQRAAGFTRTIKAVNGMGALLIGQNAGQIPDREYEYVGDSSILVYRNGGWHPVADLGYGEGVWDIGWQDLDDGTYYLYAISRSGIRYMRMPGEWDYTRDGNYYYQDVLRRDACMLLGRMNGGSNTTSKWWSTITIYGKSLRRACPNGELTSVDVYYQTGTYDETVIPTDARQWTYTGRVNEDVNEYTIPINVEARELYIMLVLRGDGTISPMIEAISVEYLARVDDARSWQVAFRTKDLAFDRNGRLEERGHAAALGQLQAWARTIRPLTLSSISPLADGYQVLIEQPGAQVLELDTMRTEEQGREVDYVSMTIIEAESEVRYGTDTIVSGGGGSVVPPGNPGGGDDDDGKEYPT